MRALKEPSQKAAQSALRARALHIRYETIRNSHSKRRQIEKKQRENHVRYVYVQTAAKLHGNDFMNNIHVCVRARARMCVCVCIYIYVYIYTHTHIHIRTHTHTYTHAYTLHASLPYLVSTIIL